jgi:hypothetical protein
VRDQRNLQREPGKNFCAARHIAKGSAALRCTCAQHFGAARCGPGGLGARTSLDLLQGCRGFFLADAESNPCAIRGPHDSQRISFCRRHDSRHRVARGRGFGPSSQAVVVATNSAARIGAATRKNSVQRNSRCRGLVSRYAAQRSGRMPPAGTETLEQPAKRPARP